MAVLKVDSRGQRLEQEGQVGGYALTQTRADGGSK